MEFRTIVDNRKSIRSFTGELISEEARKNILHAANAAPVGRALYDTVHMTIIRDKAMLKKLNENAAKIMQAPGEVLYGAPELVLISTNNQGNVGFSNAAIIVHNMVMAAVDENVGACHIWGCVMALNQNPELVAELGLPEGFVPACAVALGATNDKYEPREIPEDRIAVNVI